MLAWEGYYEKGPVDFRTETLDVLAKVGDAVPAAIELGYHLCYASPADEHVVQPSDAGIWLFRRLAFPSFTRPRPRARNH